MPPRPCPTCGRPLGTAARRCMYCGAAVAAAAPARAAVPDWCDFFTPERYAAFMQAVEGEIRRRGLQAAPEGAGFRIGGEGPLGGGVVNLFNLSQICNRCEPVRWPDEVRGFLDTMEKMKSQSEDVNRRAESFDAVAPLLKIRLYGEDQFKGADVEPVVWSVAPGLIAALVFDLPDTIQTVLSPQIAKWGKSRDDLYRLGLENVKREGRLEKGRHELEKGVVLTFLIGETFFATTHVFFLQEYVDLDPDKGAFVGLPHRDGIICVPIRSARELAVVGPLVPVVQGMFQEGPGSISPELYWWRKGALVHFPVRVVGDKLHVMPPEEFHRMILNMPGA